MVCFRSLQQILETRFYIIVSTFNYYLLVLSSLETFLCSNLYGAFHIYQLYLIPSLQQQIAGMHLIPRLNKVIPLEFPPDNIIRISFLHVCLQVGLCGHPDPLRRLLTLPRRPHPGADLWPSVPYWWPREMHPSAEIPQWALNPSASALFSCLQQWNSSVRGIPLAPTAPSPFENIIEEVIHPCNPNPCPSNHLCEVNRKGCHPGQDCLPYFCVPGTCFLYRLSNTQHYCGIKVGFIYSQLLF